MTYTKQWVVLLVLAMALAACDKRTEYVEERGPYGQTEIRTYEKEEPRTSPEAITNTLETLSHADNKQHTPQPAAKPNQSAVVGHANPSTSACTPGKKHCKCGCGEGLCKCPK